MSFKGLCDMTGGCWFSSMRVVFKGDRYMGGYDGSVEREKEYGAD